MSILLKIFPFILLMSCAGKITSYPPPIPESIPESRCGDMSCMAKESCGNCPEDCGPCPAICGDGECNGVELCGVCSEDCGACFPFCGDAICAEDDEWCGNCPVDCGECYPNH